KLTEIQILGYAGAVEKGSEHPLAAAVVNAAQGKRIELSDPSGFEALPGLGVKATVRGHEVLLGNLELMGKFSVPVEAYSERMMELQDQGKTISLLVLDRQPVGLIGLADTVKESSAPTIKALKKMGLDIVMLTGDNERTAKAIARTLGIDTVFANVGLIPIAAGILVPFLGPGIYQVLPLLAGAAMAISSVTVVSNSLLLRRFNPKI